MYTPLDQSVLALLDQYDAAELRLILDLVRENLQVMRTELSRIQRSRPGQETLAHALERGG